MHAGCGAENVPHPNAGGGAAVDAGKPRQLSPPILSKENEFSLFSLS